MAKIKWKIPAPMLVWNKLKALRLEKRLTQVQLSTYSGVAVATIWMVEQGYDKTATEKTKRRLATYFGCDISDLFPVQMIGDKTLAQHLKESQKE